VDRGEALDGGAAQPARQSAAARMRGDARQPNASVSEEENNCWACPLHKPTKTPSRWGGPLWPKY
jgi:hypothetical protein